MSKIGWILFAVVIIWVILLDTSIVCSETSRTALGNVISIEEPATSFNDGRRLMITTDKGTYFIKGIINIPHNSEIFLIERISHVSICRNRISINDRLFSTY
jgi:hypothetical protein